MSAQKLRQNGRVFENIFLADMLKDEAEFQWWNLGDSLTQLVYDFINEHENFTSCSVALLQAELIRMYAKYIEVVERELPPPIPGDL